MLQSSNWNSSFELTDFSGGSTTIFPSDNRIMENYPTVEIPILTRKIGKKAVYCRYINNKLVKTIATNKELTSVIDTTPEFFASMPSTNPIGESYNAIASDGVITFNWDNYILELSKEEQKKNQWDKTVKSASNVVVTQFTALHKDYIKITVNGIELKPLAENRELIYSDRYNAFDVDAVTSWPIAKNIDNTDFLTFNDIAIKTVILAYTTQFVDDIDIDDRQVVMAIIKGIVSPRKRRHELPYNKAIMDNVIRHNCDTVKQLRIEQKITTCLW